MAIKEEYRNMVGNKYGRLLVERVYTGKYSITYCDCKCDCGAEKKGIRVRSLLLGSTKSCGCLRRENNKDGLEDRYARIEEMVDSGMSIKDVAKEVGLSRQTIYKTYKNMTGNSLVSKWRR